MSQQQQLSAKIIAIIRGVKATEVIDVARVLVEAGIHSIEVPLNSPDPFVSIRKLADEYGRDIFIGAGTVLTVSDVEKVHAAGGRLVVSPNTNVDVISKTKALGMISLPGFMTPTEAFAAIHAGADGLKLFPAGPNGVELLSALKAVLPSHIPVYPVGGVGPGNMSAFVQAGAAGFGLGSNLYKPGMTLQQVSTNAQDAMAACAKAFK
ncbi:2-dehydro-3-deoxy-6-phosphogalactonate aldolase [Kordiimonas aquimaris]|uniref:2-dehydro-3-deoxy-6-phosphogalactonate aldolase n=1 Tax=Kordiimonas aquimaris TaxID=707591 RepID=UPI0021D05954|nr:2-dehydro-3-deoxy-6-phosphogalactonate aldolase [Kordiimonas aquimaris]